MWGVSTLLAPNPLGDGETSHCPVPDKELLVTSSPYQGFKNQAEVPAIGRAELQMCPICHIKL